MKLEHVTFVGPPMDDADILARLPPDFAGLLQQLNGFVQFHGGLHVRGACREPDWHSLRDAWVEENALHRLYPEVRPEDVPFGEDCMGDQFLLREGLVWRLAAETGEMESLGTSFGDFLHSAQADPVEHLSMQPLLQFQQEGGTLEPGQLLASFPPFCFNQAAEGVRLSAVQAGERRRFLADLAAKLRDLPEGGSLDFTILE
jgi:hypothetical protein